MNNFNQFNHNQYSFPSNMNVISLQNQISSTQKDINIARKDQIMSPIVYCQDLQGHTTLPPYNSQATTPTMKRPFNSRSSSASPGSSQSTPKKRNTSEFEGSSPDYSFPSSSNSPTPELSADIVNINILNATYFKSKNDLLLMQNKKNLAQNKLKYLIDNTLSIKRQQMPFLKLKEEHIMEVINTTNFFYKNVSQEVQQSSHELNKIVTLNQYNVPNIQGLNITIGNLLMKSKQIIQNVELLKDIDTNMIEVMIRILEKIVETDVNCKYDTLIAQMHCWLLDLLVNLLPGYVHRLMNVSASREARGVSVKEFRSRKRCLADWVTVEKSLNGAKVDIYTALNRFTAVAGVSAMLQFSDQTNQIKEIISNNINDDVVQKTYNICQGLEEVMEPLRQIQKILGVCLINDENSSTLMIDPIHNPLFEKRLHGYRTGSTSSFPKKLIGELENLFHQEFIQGPTFFATQQYERRCATCQEPLGQECLLCMGCNLVRYCGESCAKEDELNHDKICRVDRFEIMKTLLDKLSEDNNCHEIEVV